MAQLVLGVAGAAIGGALGGPLGAQIGFALGSAAGASLQTVRNYGPRLSDLRSPQSSYGSVIPYIEGSIRTAGVWAWASDKRETANVTEQGKGGPSVESTNYTYSMDALVLLSENEIGGVRRIWANGKLIWTAADDADGVSLAAASGTGYWESLRIYTGASDQMPDPTYEAAVGTAYAPAYRGRGYVFIEGLALGSSGQIPMLNFEVVRQGEYSGSIQDWTSTATVTAGGERFVFTPSPSAFAANWFHPAEAYTGLRYIEYEVVGTTARGYHFGVLARDQYYDLLSEHPSNPYGSGSGWYSICNGNVFSMQIGTISNGIASPLEVVDFNIGNVIGVLCDHDARVLTVYRDGIEIWTTALPDGRGGYDPYMTCYGATAAFEVGIRKHAEDWEFSPGDVQAYEALTITTTPDTLQGAVSRQCDRAGLSSGQYDVSALSGNISGFAVTALTAPRTTLETLSTAYQFDAFESGGKVTFKPKGQAAVASVEYDDLGATEGERVEPLPLVRVNDLELPAQVVVRYANSTNDYQDGAETADRLVSSLAGAVESIELPLSLTPTEAKRIAEVRSNEVVNSAIRIEGLALDRAFAALEPCDAITIIDADGAVLRARLLRITDKGLVRQCDAALDEISASTGTAVTDSSYVSATTIGLTVSSQVSLLDIPILRDADDSTGHYAAVTKATNSGTWPGATLLRGENDAGYETVATYYDRTYIGRTTSALGAWGGGTLFDEANSFTVAGVGSLESYTRTQILEGAARPLLIGDEVLFYRTATAIVEGQYTVSGLLRGRRGTEAVAAVGSASGVRAVLLQEQGVRRIETNAAKVGVSMDFKPVTIGKAADSVTATAFTCNNIGARPFAPVDARFSSSGGVVTVEWKRRTRYAVGFTGATGPSAPLGEVSEAYEVDVLQGSPLAVVATIEATTPSANLSTAAASLTLAVGAERLVRRADTSIVGLEWSDPSFIVACASDGSFDERSSYFGSDVQEIAASSSTLYVAVRQSDGIGGWASAKLRSVPLDSITSALENPPAASQTAATAGDYGGVTWDGLNPWTVGSITGYLRRHNASTLAVEVSILVQPPVAPLTEAYLRHVASLPAVGSPGDGLLFTVCAGGPAAGDVIAIDPTGSPTERWRVNVTGAGLATGNPPLQVVGSTLLVPTDAGWALLDAYTGASIASSSAGEQVPPRAVVSSTEFVVRKSSSEPNVALVRSTVDGSLVRTVTGIGSGAIIGAFEGAVIQKRSTPSGTYVLGDIDVMAGDVVRIYQLSDTYGRGLPLEATVPSL